MGCRISHSKNDTSAVTSDSGIINGRSTITALRVAVLIAIGSADRIFLLIHQDVSSVHVIGQIADIDLCRDELHGDIIADVVNGNRGVLTDLTSGAIECELCIQVTLSRKNL